MRINECLMIQVTDVNLPKRYIYLPAENTKGKKGRHVFFSDKMATQLQRWIKYKDRYRDSDFLFCTNKGKFLEVSNFEKNVRKYAQRIGLKDIHPHVFRNNFAKRFLMSGGDIYTLISDFAVRWEALEEYLYNQALQSIRYGGMSANEMRECMALIDERTEVEILYANNAPIEYVVKGQSVDIWRHEAPVITPKRQNLVKDVLFKVVGALNSIIDFIVMALED